MKKLCVFTLYGEKGASSRYRCFIYKDLLQQEFETKWFSFWNDRYVTQYMHFKKKFALQILLLYVFSLTKRFFQLYFIAPKADVVLFQKACLPKIRYNGIRRLKKRNVKIVFDVDDAVYVQKNDYSDEIAKQADVIICGNKTLLNHYKSINESTFVLPTVENTNLFEKYWRNTFDKKIIGWIGSLTTTNNIEVVLNPLNKFLSKHPEVRFIVISNGLGEIEGKIKRCELIQWEEKKYIKDLSQISIGIMPLKDNEFNRGKCGFKLIQYLNLKKPVVASDVGVNSEIVENNGFLAHSEDEWLEYFERLLFNRTIYDDKVCNIEKFFLAKYHYNIVSKKFIDFLKRENDDFS